MSSPWSASRHDEIPHRLLGQRGISEKLRAFVAEMPWERESILDFVEEVASSLPPGARVLDVGAGDAPYRELFAHCRYTTSDWEHSAHPDARRTDVVASADALPLGDAEFDQVLLTQVLEHVPEPKAVLSEASRVLRPGGRIALTVPLVWELHELPYDYYRYTAEGIRYLLTSAGFVDCDIQARTDSFRTLAQLTRNVSWSLGRAGDGLDAQRGDAQRVLQRMADELAALAPLDVRRLLPLGYEALARTLPTGR